MDFQLKDVLDAYRHPGAGETRRASLGDQILQYKRRCEYMRLATNIGIVAAVVLIGGLIAGALHTIFGVEALKYVSAAGAVFGLIGVIAGAIVVLIEAREAACVDRIMICYAGLEQEHACLPIDGRAPKNGY